jgi:glycine cleavage system transcriptional repressor
VAHFAVSVIGRDRPGIVAAIADGLLDLDGNIEDSRMTILRGHFAMMLVVSLPGDDAGPLRGRLGRVRDELGLEAVAAEPVAELAEAEAARPSHVVSVYGADHPGIVREVSTALAERGVNITDLQTQLVGTVERPLYVMMLEVDAAAADPAELESALGMTGERAQVDISVSELGSDTL